MQDIDQISKNGYVVFNGKHRTNGNAFPVNSTGTGGGVVQVNSYEELVRSLPYDLTSEITFERTGDSIIAEYEARGFEYVRIEITSPDTMLGEKQRESVSDRIERQLRSIGKVRNVEAIDPSVKYVNDVDYTRMQYTIELKSNRAYINSDGYNIDYHIGHKVTSKIRSLMNELEPFIEEYEYRIPERVETDYELYYRTNEIVLTVDIRE